MKVYERYKATFWGASCAVGATLICLVVLGPLRFILDSHYSMALYLVTVFAGWLAMTIHAGIDANKE